MIIGVPKELKPDEYRVGLVPAGVKALSEEGHTVYIEAGAGEGSGISDREYEEAGARILEDPDEVWARADLIIKVKEPIPIEYARLREGQILFTYLHLAPAPELTRELLARKVTGIAYETITDAEGRLPLLTPMSEVAGRMAVQVGATYLQKTHGGRGVLLGGVPGVLPANVVILGAGVVGTNATRIAVGMGAQVTVIDKNLDRLRYLDDIFGSQIRTLVSNTYNIWNAIENADLVICGVLIPGAAAPKLITREMLSCMHKGAVIVDVSVDQGGCVETSRPTTHSDPVFFVDDVLHYCVPNMPGAVPRTSTFALTNVTLPYAVKLASLGVWGAIRSDPGLRLGVNTYRGYVTHPAVAESQGLEYTPLEDIA
ncbi:Alanine dehydrogenase [bacterium HR08]|nr:Alanine dehydrogenase [bacterium HR08]